MAAAATVLDAASRCLNGGDDDITVVGICGEIAGMALSKVIRIRLDGLTVFFRSRQYGPANTYSADWQ